MRKVTPYRANACPKTCWNCGSPFIVRDGRAEAIVGHDDRLYCYKNGCDEAALLPLAMAMRRVSAFSCAA